MTGRFGGSARPAPGVMAAIGAALLIAPAIAGLSGCGSSSSRGAAFALEQQFEAVIKAVLPSVVQIDTGTTTGSGVVYDRKGDIVTNAHVVGSAAVVSVQPAGGGTLRAHVLGVFAPDDLAVIRVTSGAGSLHPAVFGDSSDVPAGQIVMAMGNPLGLTGSVTQGIISATGRMVSESGTSGGATVTIAHALQTSAAINGGNSGGALVDLSGQVIGVPTATARDPQDGPAPGIGFAIPSDTVTSIAGQLISTGKVTRPG
jgi:putative serine protease PepD